MLPPLIGVFPPPLILEESESLLEVILGFDRRGVRFAPFISREGLVEGVVALRDAATKLLDLRGPLPDAARSTPARSIANEAPRLRLGEYTLTDVIEYLSKRGVGAAIVVDDSGRAIGIVTERQLVDLIDASKAYVSVREIATLDVATLAPEDSLADALKVMREVKCRHVPLVDSDGKPVGMVSARDAVRDASTLIEEGGSAEELLARRLEEYKRPVVAVEASDDVSRALRLMRRYAVSSVVVTVEGRLIGILTDRDLLTKLPAVEGVDRFYDELRCRIVYGRLYA